MDKKFLDLTSVEKKTQVRETVRKAIFEAIEQVLRDNFTEVEYLKEAQELGVVVGQADNNGFTSDVIAVVKVECKNWYDSIGPKGRVTAPFREEYDTMVKELKFKKEQNAIKAAKKR